MSQSWKSQALKGQLILSNSIPKQFLIPENKLPPPTELHVADFPHQSGLFSPGELAITETSASALVQKMGGGKLSAEEVVTAFIKRAVVGHQLLNFATEFMAEEAISRARELDEYFRRTGRLVGPLHGVPISVKEHIGMKDRVCNAGFVAWTDKTLPEDALILQYLHNAGAVFHVRTNQPQSLMHLCCANNITGRTLNPHNRTLTPGGSSGGEGASTGFKCAPLGIGTDIGGSIRCPAAFCGAYGFKPTGMRNPVNGIKVPCSGQESVRGIVGPLGSVSVEDLGLFQKALLEQQPWMRESGLVPLEWRAVDMNAVKKMTVGILWDDGIVHPHPPVTRALHQAKTKLLQAGFNVVDWTPYKHDHGWKILAALYFPDAAASQYAVLNETNEPLHTLTKHAFAYSRSTPLTINENWALNEQREIYRDEYTSLMQSRGVDFILSPVYPGAAAVYGESEYWGYTAIWNLLDFPGVSFPSGVRVSSSPSSIESEEYKPRNEVDDREWRKYTTSPGRYAGAPIGLQVCGGRFKDEETVAFGGLVSEVLKGENDAERVDKARL